MNFLLPLIRQPSLHITCETQTTNINSPWISNRICSVKGKKKGVYPSVPTKFRAIALWIEYWVIIMQESEASNSQTCQFSWVRTINCKLHLTLHAGDKSIPFTNIKKLKDIFSSIELHLPQVSTTPLWWQKSLAFLLAPGW